MTGQHGGRRPGAGRKPGSAARKTREIADRAAEEGITPLEVMLKAMRIHADAERWDDAASVAKDAAPYMHARLSSVDMQANVNMTQDDAVDRFEAEAGAEPS